MIRKRISQGIAIIFLFVCVDGALATNAELDNFDGRFTGARGYWDSSVVYTRDLTNANAFMGQYTMQVVYNKALGGIWDYFGYDAGGGYDFSAYDRFGLRVYSVLNNTMIQINILDADSDEMRYGSQTVNQGAGWQLMSFNLPGGVFVANGNGSFDWGNVRRILFFVWGGNGAAAGIFRMDEMQFYNSTLSSPTIDSPLTDVNQDGTYTAGWNGIPDATIYEIWTDDSSMFVDANAGAGSGWVQSWSSANSADVTVPVNGTWRNMIRAWSAHPDSGGSCSLWSGTESIDIVIDRLCFLDVVLEGAGTGTVTGNPGGIDCPGTCREGFRENSKVILSAVPDSGHVFGGWSGGGCTGKEECAVTMDQDKTVTAAFLPDMDGDGISDSMENNGPNNGDGNDNGTQDAMEANVATFQHIHGGWVTLVSEIGTALGQVTPKENPSPEDAPPGTFGCGFFSFSISGLTPGASTTAQLIFHDEVICFQYYKYGPTSSSPQSSWYDFTYDGETGAVFSDPPGKTRVILHFKDGSRGDDDLQADGTIVDPSGPITENAATSDSGGCFISTIK